LFSKLNPTFFSDFVNGSEILFFYIMSVMKIISWNVNGIRAVHKKGLFVPFVKKYKPDIICLQETKAEEHQSEVDLPEYEEYWNSASRKGYSGTAIFTKSKPLSVALDIPEKIAKKFKNLSDKYGEANSEGRVITAEFKDFYVVSVYTPNAKDDLSRIPLRHKMWDPAFLEYMKKLENGSADSPPKPVIFCGDLNVAHTALDLARPKENVGKKGFTDEERTGINNIIGSGFVDTFRIFEKKGGHYSWWSHFANARARNIGWRIDYIFASKKLEKKIKSAKILPEVMGSDHCPVLIEIK
jgi:exodeoxyribonuclease III